MLCCIDRCGDRTTRAAQAAGFSVPEDVATLGVDEDDLVCRALPPELPSVALPLSAIGKRAATLLDALLHGEAMPATPIELPPVGGGSPESSRIRGVEDPLVRRVGAHMFEYLHEGIDVARVVGESGVSRRTLEYRCHNAMGCTPHTDLTRLQCQLAGDLLRTTALPLEGVAERCGFACAGALSDTFTKHMGQRPGAYRRGVHGLIANPAPPADQAAFAGGASGGGRGDERHTVPRDREPPVRRDAAPSPLSSSRRLIRTRLRLTSILLCFALIRIRSFAPRRWLVEQGDRIR